MKSSRLLCFVLGVALAGAARAREEWFAGLDLEENLSRADLVLVARVAEVSEFKIISGGKREIVQGQFKFQPLRTLKGVFARDALSLTSSDLGGGTELARIKQGQIYLLMLDRSEEGYRAVRSNYPYEAAAPNVFVPLSDENDLLVASAKTLLAMTETHDRAKKVSLALDGLRAADGPSAVPLLFSLKRRAIIAAQTPAAAPAITKFLRDNSPAVRTAAAATLADVLEADYLEKPALREAALSEILAALASANENVDARVAAFDVLGHIGVAALRSDAALRQLQFDQPTLTIAERDWRLKAIGKLKLLAQRDAVQKFFENLPLDEHSGYSERFQFDSFIQLDPAAAAKLLAARIQTEIRIGLNASSDISALGKLPAENAVPAILEAAKIAPDEKHAIVVACYEIHDARLVPVVAANSEGPDQLRSLALSAMMRIDTDEAAKFVQPHLGEQPNIWNKLRIAKFLGRHGIRDGYPYAIEHMSEHSLREDAVAAIAAIREPKAVAELRKILETSNDVSWNSAAVRALGALGDKESTPRFLAIAQDLKNPLAPSALIALGDLGEANALPKIREGLTSRNDEIVTASARAAGKLLALPNVKAEDIRDTLAALVADPDAKVDARTAALESLLALNDPRLDKALAAAVRDAGLGEDRDAGGLRAEVEKLLRERKVKLTLP